MLKLAMALQLQPIALEMVSSILKAKKLSPILISILAMLLSLLLFVITKTKPKLNTPSLRKNNLNLIYA
jgi:hypothetical protein